MHTATNASPVAAHGRFGEVGVAAAEFERQGLVTRRYRQAAREANRQRQGLAYRAVLFANVHQRQYVQRALLAVIVKLVVWTDHSGYRLPVFIQVADLI